MNRQKIFSTVATHLLNQNQRCVWEDGGTCCYRNANNQKCGIGAIIPDGHKGETFEGGVVSLMKEYPDLAKLWGVNLVGLGADESFLLDLQGVHDKIMPYGWKHALSNFADKHELAMV